MDLLHKHSYRIARSRSFRRGSCCETCSGLSPDSLVQLNKDACPFHQGNGSRICHKSRSNIQFLRRCQNPTILFRSSLILLQPGGKVNVYPPAVGQDTQKPREEPQGGLSAQTLYLSPPCKHESSFTPLRRLSAKSMVLRDARTPAYFPAAGMLSRYGYSVAGADRLMRTGKDPLSVYW